MSFQNKYLKYKSKYLDLKKQIGGALQPRPTLPQDVMNNIVDNLTNKEIINRCILNNIDCQAVLWSKLIIDRKININSVLNLDDPIMCQNIIDPIEKKWCRMFYNYMKYMKYINPFKTIACHGRCSMVIRPDGTVRAFGIHCDLQGNRDSPDDLNNVVSIAVGDSHGIALKDDGTVVTWGQRMPSYLDVPHGLINVVSIAAGSSHNMALKNDGTVVAWGRNKDCNNVPTGLNNVVAIAAGHTHCIAVKNDGTVVTWGSNMWKQRDVPEDLSNVVAIAAGEGHNIALKNDGTLVAWGLNSEGQCIIPDGLNNVVSIACGFCHSLALKNDGTVVAWGCNDSNQCVVPRGLRDVVAIAAGGDYSLALQKNGTVVRWANNKIIGVIARVPSN